MKYLKFISKGERISLRIILLFLLVCTTSCSKNVNVDNTSAGKITVYVGGIVEADEQDQHPMSTSRLMGSSNQNNVDEKGSTKNVFKYDDLEIDFISEEEPIRSFGNSEVGNQINPIQATNRASTTQQMESGIKYWFLLYNKTTKRFEHSIQGISGTELRLPLVRNEEYDWYAYSYNSRDIMSEFNLSTLEIESSIDRPMLYASGQFKTKNEGDVLIEINFKHQLKQIVVELDSRGVFGNLENIEGTFDNEEYVKTGVFNVINGSFTSTKPAPIAALKFEFLDRETRRLKTASYYSADSEHNKYGFLFSKIDVELINNTSQNLIPENDIKTLYGPTFLSKDSKGKIHHSKIKLWKLIPEKHILHLEGSEAYSYAASQPGKASGAFLQSPLNFGINSNYLRIKGFRHEVIITPRANQLRDRLANPSQYPDIIIAGMFTGATQEDYRALRMYLDRGGVVFLMIENKTLAVDEFFSELFRRGTRSFSGPLREGNVYKIENVDGDVLSFPFADVRNKYWGQDGGHTLYVENIPSNMMNDIFVYSRGSVNTTPLRDNKDVSMFRHKTLNLFFVGDTGLLANNRSNGIGEPVNFGRVPFATDRRNFPSTKPYGYSSMLRAIEPGKATGAWHVNNAALFGNVFALLVAQSHYMGVNRSK